MRFLYTKATTTYESILAAIKEAEIEWMESKGQIRMKTATMVDRSEEIEDLKQKLEKFNLKSITKAVYSGHDPLLLPW